MGRATSSLLGMLMLVGCGERAVDWTEPENLLLRETVTEFVAHYHGERPHQGLDHRILEPGPEVGESVGDVDCRERLGGLLKYYHRQAA